MEIMQRCIYLTRIVYYDRCKLPIPYRNYLQPLYLSVTLYACVQRVASDAFLLLREYVTGLLSIPIYLHSSDGAYYGMVMSVHPSVRVSVRHSFPHFSPTCFDILSWNFACHFLLINIRSSSSIVNFRQFL